MTQKFIYVICSKLYLNCLFLNSLTLSLTPETSSTLAPYIPKQQLRPLRIPSNSISNNMQRTLSPLPQPSISIQQPLRPFDILVKPYRHSKRQEYIYVP